MPPSRDEGDGPARQRDCRAARPTQEHAAARARTQSVCRRLSAGQRRAPGLGAQAARLDDRALHPPARPRRGPSCHGRERGPWPQCGRASPADIPGADRGADEARRSGAQGRRGVHLSPRLQPDRSARRAAQDARAAQAEARTKATQRPARARHPQPDTDPAAADKGPSSQPVRPLGGRPHARVSGFLCKRPPVHAEKKGWRGPWGRQSTTRFWTSC